MSILSKPQTTIETTITVKRRAEGGAPAWSVVDEVVGALLKVVPDARLADCKLDALYDTDWCQEYARLTYSSRREVK